MSYLTDEIKVQGRVHLWSIIDTCDVNGKTYALLESTYYGDEAGMLVVILPTESEHTLVKLKNGKQVTYILEEKEVCETFDDLQTALEDEGIIGDSYTLLQ